MYVVSRPTRADPVQGKRDRHMKYEATDKPALWALDKVADHSVIALHKLEGGVPVLSGKGAPRELVGGQIVVTDKMSTSLKLANYVDETGHVFVIGTVHQDSTPKVAAAQDRVTQSGRSAEVKVTKAPKTAGKEEAPNLTAAGHAKAHVIGLCKLFGSKAEDLA